MIHRVASFLACCLLALTTGVQAQGDAARPPVVIGLDAELSVPDSTSGHAIRMGILTAIDEVNAAGGLLGGRRMELVTRDNRSVPARGIDNLEELAALPNLLAVYCTKYSPVCVEQAALAQRLKVLLLDPWAAADPIVPADPRGSWVFRLSLRDSWAMPAMMRHLGERGLTKVGVLLPTSAWGRSSDAVLATLANDPKLPVVVAKEWYPWGTPSLREQYLNLLKAGATGVLMVANEREGAILIREVAPLEAHRRVPIVSHWGITGGPFTEMTGDAWRQVDLSVVQIFTLHGQSGPKARAAVERAMRLFKLKSADEIPSQSGFGTAYDLTRLLARAVTLAGSSDRAAVRDALERVRGYEGLVARLEQPFSPTSHEALTPAQVFIGRFSPSGAVVRPAR